VLALRNPPPHLGGYGTSNSQTTLENLFSEADSAFIFPAMLNAPCYPSSCLESGNFRSGKVRDISIRAIPLYVATLPLLSFRIPGSSRDNTVSFSIAGI